MEGEMSEGYGGTDDAARVASAASFSASNTAQGGSSLNLSPAERRQLAGAQADIERRNQLHQAEVDWRRNLDIRSQALSMATATRTAAHEDASSIITRASAFERFLRGEVTAAPIVHQQV